MHRPIDDVLNRLQGVKKNGAGYTAFCPAHDDKKGRSLSIGEGDDRRALVNCFAGCETLRVVESISLTMADLFPHSQSGNGAGSRGGGIPPETDATLQPSVSEGCTLAQYAAAKRLPVAFLRGIGLSEITYVRAPAVRIPYFGLGAEEASIRFRIGLTKSDNRFKWKSGSKAMLYGLWRLKDYGKEYIVVVEGESDCHTLWLHDLPAIGIPGADNWKDERDAPHLDGFDKIFVVIEGDNGGESVKKWLARSRIRDRVYLVDLGERKDPSGLYLADPENFKDNWQAALDIAESWEEHEFEQVKAARNEAWELCKDIAQEQDNLKRFYSDAQRRGVVGEERACKLLYLIICTRFLDKLVSATVKGPSSSGKSWLLEQVLAFFPASACYVLSTMSEKALAYSEEPVAHKFMVFYEASGLNNDFATYLVRSLLSEGRIRYETVDKTSDGLKARLIEREGPTGLITTTTAVRLHPENETRLLSIPVTDSQQQTAGIFAALADEAERDEIDMTPWHALQIWLEGGEHRVTIPYGKALADLMKPIAVRLRRDFRAVLQLIRAHAVLHQANRRRDAEGRVVAGFEDYAAVRELVADLVSEGVDSTVSETVRETVGAVSDIILSGENSATTTQVASQLKLDKSSALRRVNTAINKGYLKNEEDRKGRPARLVLGEPVPDNMEIIPTVAELEAWGCRVASNLEGIDTPSSQPDEMRF